VGIPRDELLADVEEFCTENGISEHLEIFRKGALLAQNPREYDTMDDFDATEREALHIERTKRWAQTKTLYFTIFLNSIAAAIQGWDQTGELTVAFALSNDC
jgi:hypothetical protein